MRILSASVAAAQSRVRPKVVVKLRESVANVNVDVTSLCVVDVVDDVKRTRLDVDGYFRRDAVGTVGQQQNECVT